SRRGLAQVAGQLPDRHGVRVLRQLLDAEPLAEQHAQLDLGHGVHAEVGEHRARCAVEQVRVDAALVDQDPAQLRLTGWVAGVRAHRDCRSVVGGRRRRDRTAGVEVAVPAVSGETVPPQALRRRWRVNPVAHLAAGATACRNRGSGESKSCRGLAGVVNGLASTDWRQLDWRRLAGPTDWRRLAGPTGWTGWP